MTESSDFSRRTCVGFAEGTIEPPHTSKTGDVRNFTERQNRFVDQFLGKVQTTRLDHRGWRGAKMLEKQTAQLSTADAQARGEPFDSFVFNAAFANQAQRAANSR